MDNLRHCPLCSSENVSLFYRKNHEFYSCRRCRGLFRARSTYVDSDAEKSRYEEHNNDVFDKHYQQFVSPITSSVLHDFDKHRRGLDFGSGTGPVISKVLEDEGYNIVQYDPFFARNENLLKEGYDYIVCCEVIEHFQKPFREFRLLKSLLLPGGKLYCMTNLYDGTKDFHGWNYKNDPTHVFIYSEETLRWIKEALGFSRLTVEGRLIVFGN
ncbi:class I SAM-dependent methyltransferase [Sinomicrobium sp. M5D2P17]